MHHEDPERRVLPQHHHQQQANFQVVNGRFGYPNASMTAAVPYYVGGDGVPWPREAPGDGFPPAAPFTFNHLPPAALSCSSSSSSSSSSSFSAYSSHQTLGSGLVKRKSKRSPVSKLMNLKSSPRTNRVAAPSAAAAAAAAAASVLTTVIRDCASAGSHSSLSAGNPSSIGGDDVSPGDSNEAAKKCKVCGDRAVNHNFGQLTCESCKAFFRRNAHKELTCTSKTGEHVVSPTTRRECPACRLKRCFLIGMRPDLIQVRKKDGSKPRWLDKSPTAAQVHELHLLNSEGLCGGSCVPGFPQRGPLGRSAFATHKQAGSASPVTSTSQIGAAESFNFGVVFSPHPPPYENCYPPPTDLLLKSCGDQGYNLSTGDPSNFPFEPAPVDPNRQIQSAGVSEGSSGNMRLGSLLDSFVKPEHSYAGASGLGNQPLDEQTGLGLPESAFGVPLRDSDRSPSAFLPGITGQTVQAHHQVPLGYSTSEGVFSNASVAEKAQQQLPPIPSRYAWNDSYANPDVAFICSTPSWIPYSSSSSSSPPLSSVPPVPTVVVQHRQATNFDNPQQSHTLFPLATVAASTALASNDLATKHATIHQLSNGQQDPQLLHSYTTAYSGDSKPCHLSMDGSTLSGTQTSTPPHLPPTYSTGNYSEPMGFHGTGVSHSDWLPELKADWPADDGGGGDHSPFRGGGGVSGMEDEAPRLHNLTPLPVSAQADDLEAHRSVEQPNYLSLDDDTSALNTSTTLAAASAKQWFPLLLDAWTTAWSDGVFPNPADVSLHLDLNSSPALQWRLALANIWADLLMRRVLAFVSRFIGMEFDQTSSNVISPDSFYCRTDGDETGLLSKETFLWICKNRLISCVPIFLAKSIIQPLVCGLGVPKNWPSLHLANPPATFETHLTPVKSPGPAKLDSSEFESDTPLLSPAATSHSQIGVCFQVPPKHRVFISLSTLSQRLSEVTALSPTRTTSPAFPMLQYLDSYVCELHKFLAENPLLLGSFMILKLTQPPNPQEVALCEIDLQQLQVLNTRLVSVFCAAADHVGDGLPRRHQLSDFLDWGRQFDADMEAFLRDTCEHVREHVEVLEDVMTGYIISPGLAAFCGVEENASPALTNSHNHLQQQLHQSQSSASSTPSLSGTLETRVSEIENFT
uniref:Nuclear hormone receptor family member nhr-48 n=1 Tax=Schistocephalus solidus TaxID=70667 RepID=A0A0X3PIA4_SCHSO